MRFNFILIIFVSAKRLIVFSTLSRRNATQIIFEKWWNCFNHRMKDSIYTYMFWGGYRHV
ncbi:MAG: hypothetical protein RLZZ628_3176 [Bacteroidota bacterium]|jgi:hypothetical protein